MFSALATFHTTNSIPAGEESSPVRKAEPKNLRIDSRPFSP